MPDQPGSLPAELVEHRHLIGDVGLDIARPLERRGVQPALLGQDAVDETIELLDQPDDVLRTDARTTVKEDRARTFTSPRGEDLATGDPHPQLLEPHPASTLAVTARYRRRSGARPVRHFVDDGLSGLDVGRSSGMVATPCRLVRSNTRADGTAA